MRRLLVALLLALVIVPIARTASFSATLTSSSPQTFTGITLNGVDQFKTLNLSVTVAYTGGGNTAGWNVTAAATTLTSGTHTMSPLAITNVTRANCTGGGCVNPTNSVTWPLDLSSTATKIYNAAATTGKGTVVLTPVLQITYDADAFPGTYTSTLTVTGSTGP